MRPALWVAAALIAVAAYSVVLVSLKPAAIVVYQPTVVVVMTTSLVVATPTDTPTPESWVATYAVGATATAIDRLWGATGTAKAKPTATTIVSLGGLPYQNPTAEGG